MDASALKKKINQQARHKLLFVEPDITDLQFVDLGKELALKLADKLDSKMLPMIAEDALDEIIDNHADQHPDLGDYVAFKNIGILFEADLKLNLHDKFDQYARSKVCIVKLEGVVQQQIFYLGKTQLPSYAFSLKDLSHQIIYENK